MLDGRGPSVPVPAVRRRPASAKAGDGRRAPWTYDSVRDKDLRLDTLSVHSEFERARQGLRATGASVSTYEVVGALERHGHEEGELLERYQRFIEEAESPAARYLIQLIVEDEQRHHQVLEALANTIAWGRVKGEPEAVVPVFPARGGVNGALRPETRALLEHELRDRTQLRRLRRRVRSYGDDPSWGLLVDIMRSDTEKHIHILRCILRSQVRPSHLRRMFRRLRLARF